MNDSTIETRPEPRRYKLLFADTHQMLLDAFQLVLGAQYDVGVACCVQEFEDAVRLQLPDLAILNIDMPDGDGIKAGRWARSVAPTLKVLFLSEHSGEAYLRRAFGAGASGLLSKTASATDLLNAIQAVVSGGRYPEDFPSLTENRSELTHRQKQVLTLISYGMSAKEVATHLGISVRTAELHRASIRDRLNLPSSAEMTRYAIDHGLD